MNEPHLKEPSRQDWAIIKEEMEILAKVQSGLLKQTNPSQEINYHNDIIDLRDSLSETHAEDHASVVAQMERLVLLANQQQKNTGAPPINLSSPYFAHIQVQEDNRQRDILIGNQHLHSPHIPWPIIDWKNAPISCLYYRYQEGEEYVEDIGDREVQGLLTIRRTLSIEEGELTRIVTQDAQYVKNDQGWHRQERELSKLTVNTSRIRGSRSNLGTGQQIYRKDKHLQEITPLIDQQQFEIITRPRSGVVVIQGGAGSGKTTIALHRLAFLASQFPQQFRPDEIMTVVFNKALANYISKILPSLGVGEVQTSIYQEWVAWYRRRYFNALPNRHAENTPLAVIEVKRHPAMLRWIEEEVNARKEELLTRLRREVGEIGDYPKVELAWNFMEDLPLVPRIVSLVEWAHDRETLLVPRLDNFVVAKRIESLVEELFPDLLKDNTSLALQIWEDCFIHEERLQATMQRLAPGVFSEQRLNSVWKWCVQQYERRQNIDIEVVDEEASKEVNNNDLGALDEEDDTLLLLLAQLTLGRLKGKGKRPVQYNHLLVDEAQDFSTVELKLLLDTTPPKRKSVTLAGDFDQKIVKGAQVDNWQEMLGYLKLETMSIEPLKIGYRSTHEIMEVAKAVIGPLSVNPDWQAVRSGEPVELFEFSNHGQMAAFLADSLNQLMVSERNANVAVLTRYPSQANLIYEALSRAELPRLRRVKDQDFSFEPGIEVTDIAQVKGLEFDYVILLDVDSQVFPDDPLSRHLLYVGITRAAHQLWLMSCYNPSPLLPLELIRKGTY